MIVAVPALTPHTLAEAEPDEDTEAIVRSLLLHVPPAVALVRAVHEPAHITPVPRIGETGVTETVMLAAHPSKVVYCIEAVPGATPHTKPVPSTVATARLKLVQ